MSTPTSGVCARQSLLTDGGSLPPGLDDYSSFDAEPARTTTASRLKSLRFMHLAGQTLQRLYLLNSF
jgi:hypothetical protein